MNINLEPDYALDREELHRFEWQMSKVYTVLDATRKMINDIHLVEKAAEAFAWNVYSNHEICPITNMDYSDAICFLQYMFNGYEKELKDEYNEYLQG